METYPLLQFRAKRMLSQGRIIPLATVLATPPKSVPLYVLDWDGIGNNAPNYNTYHRLSPRFQLWADAGPRSLADVEDLVLAGASTVVLRPSLWPLADPGEIKKVTDCELYQYQDGSAPLLPNITGVVAPDPTVALGRSAGLPIYLLDLGPTVPSSASVVGGFVDFAVYFSLNVPV